MAVVISLRDVIEALDLQSDELSSYLDPDSGEIITFNEEEASMAQGENWDHAPNWMRESLPKIKRALEDERMLPLPDQAHIDEWRMMQDFAGEQCDCKVRDKLADAVHGAGAFRLFRHTIADLGIEEMWQQYRSKAMERVAVEWLEDNKLRYR